MTDVVQKIMEAPVTITRREYENLENLRKAAVNEMDIFIAGECGPELAVILTAGLAIAEVRD